MFDFHVHSIFSDGVLIPSEICRRYVSKGFKAIAITDHCDVSNLEDVILPMKKFVSSLPGDYPLRVFCGVELTHLPVSLISPMVREARGLGADIVVVHGETITEPVEQGTNRAAIEAEADILAHPGFIAREDAMLAAEKGVLLEVTTRKGHSYANGWVAKIAGEVGAGLIVNNDAHTPADILDYTQMIAIAKASGLDGIEGIVSKNAQDLFERISSVV